MGGLISAHSVKYWTTGSWKNDETNSILSWRSAFLIIMKLSPIVSNCNTIFHFSWGLWSHKALLNTAWNENQWRSRSIYKHLIAALYNAYWYFRLVIDFHFEHLIIGTIKGSFAITDAPECIRQKDKNLSFRNQL